MGFVPRSGSRRHENWVLMIMLILLGGIFGYIIYDVVMSTASELLQRLLIISPLLIVIAVHWLSRMPASSSLSFLLPGSNPGDIHRAGGSPWVWHLFWLSSSFSFPTSLILC
uniref:Uncharacterized protein n=1 Tax=Opuntia streptacantha TaxID=393608 RepID=A0A7C8Z429_OPUST